MSVLQVFQAKLLCDLDESGRDHGPFVELRTTTDLALRATKAMTQEMIQLLAAAQWSIPLRIDRLSQAQGKIWHPQLEMWSLHIWPLDGRLIDSQRDHMANTILEARAPSTPRLYALKWSVFSDWYSACNQDLISCDVSHVLIFLQGCWTRGTPLPRLRSMWQLSQQIILPRRAGLLAEISWLLSSLEALGGWILLALRLYPPGTYL